MPPRPPEKGIQSISSYFKPKTTSSSSTTHSRSTSDTTPSQILILDSSDDDEPETTRENATARPDKRIKLEPDPAFDDPRSTQTFIATSHPTSSPPRPTAVTAAVPILASRSYERLKEFSYDPTACHAGRRRELTKEEQNRRDLFMKKLVGGGGKRSNYLQQDHFMAAQREGIEAQEYPTEEMEGGEEADDESFTSNVENEDAVFDDVEEDPEQGSARNGKDMLRNGSGEARREVSKSGGIAARFARFAAKGNPNSTTKDSSPSTLSNVKYTPLEQQVIALKKANPGVLLAVEVGYKYKFFEEDAQTASKVLNIACFPQQHMLTASIPTHRLDIHTRRLINAGHKVGIVRQIETAALKKISENKSKPFTRALTHVYTSATFVDELGVDDYSNSAPSIGREGGGGGGTTATLMCLVEESIGIGKEKVRIAIVAAMPSTGEVVWDEFEDGLMRSELETRMLHLQPSELLLQKDLSPATESIVKHLAGQYSSSTSGSTCRVERIPKQPAATKAISQITEFYAQGQQERREKEMRKVPSEIILGDTDDEETGQAREVRGGEREPEYETRGGQFPNPSQETEIVEEEAPSSAADFQVLDLPKLVLISLSSLITHLSAFKLSALFLHTSSFNSFSSRTTMTLNGNTIQNLELLRNNTDYKETGSLIQVLDRCKTGMGKRLLRKWISKPLLSVDAVNERLDAISEIHSASSNLALARIRELLKSLPDLERGLSRIHFGRASPNELLRVLEALIKIGTVFEPLGGRRDDEFGLKSRLLASTVRDLPKVKGTVVRLMEQVNGKSARDGKKEDLFEREQEWPELVGCKAARDAVEADIQEELRKARKLLKKPTLQFKQVSLEEYLLEVKVSEKNIVPADWLRINGTKTYYRFRSPSLQKKIQELEQARERLAAAANAAYLSFLQEVASHYAAFRTAIASLSTIDCLFSLAVVALENNYVRPEIEPTEVGKLVIRQGRHAIIEQVLNDPFVPNDIEFGEGVGRRQMILTGLNMGGKSSLSKSIALIALLAQIGSFVPAESCTTSLFDGIYTRMGASDSLSTNRSTFMLELTETSEILKLATPKSLIILDELGRGTSTNDGEAIASAVLEWLSLKRQSLTVFVTHYPNLAILAKRYPNTITVNHMSCLESNSTASSPRVDNSDSNNGASQNTREDITFLYKLVDGLAASSHGLNVAKMAGIPSSVLDIAREKREELERTVRERVEKKKRERLETVVKGVRNLCSVKGFVEGGTGSFLEICRSVIGS